MFFSDHLHLVSSCFGVGEFGCSLYKDFPRMSSFWLLERITTWQSQVLVVFGLGGATLRDRCTAYTLE